MSCAKRGEAKQMLSSCGAEIAVPNRMLYQLKYGHGTGCFEVALQE